MSADNGTYILSLKDGYKVAQIFAVENLFMEKRHVINAFKDKLSWVNKEKAFNYAFMLEMENKTEHGVLMLKHYQNKTWKELQSWVSLYSP